MEQKTFTRKFGQNRVTVTGDKIAITGDFYSNQGMFYEFNFDVYKYHIEQKRGAYTCPQVIGMDGDYGTTPTIIRWLENLILAGKLDYLVK